MQCWFPMKTCKKISREKSYQRNCDKNFFFLIICANFFVLKFFWVRFVTIFFNRFEMSSFCVFWYNTEFFDKKCWAHISTLFKTHTQYRTKRLKNRNKSVIHVSQNLFCIRGCFALISFLKKCSSHCTPLVKHCTMLGRFSPSSCDQHICVPSFFISHFILWRTRIVWLLNSKKCNTYVVKEIKNVQSEGPQAQYCEGEK